MFGNPGTSLHHPGRGRPVRHRCGGALCGPGALRQETDPARVVLRRHAVIDVELLRPRCVAASNPDAVEESVLPDGPEWALAPLIALATAATVIASQALITGAFSVTKQVVQLGYLPRLDIQHTSEQEAGQIYIPAVNWSLFGAIVLAVLFFRSSSNLAAAYGIAVTLDMLITTTLTFFVIRYAWGYSLALCIAATATFFVIDLAFFSSNLLKLFAGGWFPLAIGGAVFGMMTTWRRGRDILSSKLREDALELPDFLEAVFVNPPARVDGTAVFLNIEKGAVPARIPAQLEAQQGAASSQPVRHRPQPSRAVDSAGGTSSDRVTGPQLLAGADQLWVQGRARRPASARAPQERGLQDRADDHQLFPLTRHRHAYARERHGRRGARRSSPRCTETRARRQTSSNYPTTQWWSLGAKSRYRFPGFDQRAQRHRAGPRGRWKAAWAKSTRPMRSEVALAPEAGRATLTSSVSAVCLSPLSFKRLE